MNDQRGYDISAVEARDRAKAAEQDRITDLLPKAGEDRPMWIMRALGAILTWWRKPRSRVGFVLLACVCLLQGCATAAWHNYQVAEAEADERQQIEAGFIPLVKTNAQIVKQNWFGYVVGLVIDVLTGVIFYRYVERDDRDNRTYVTNNETNNFPPPEPEPAIDGPNGL